MTVRVAAPESIHILPISSPPPKVDVVLEKKR
jgi:hypothetical protein